MSKQSDFIPQGRLISLDAFRGLTMFFLVAEGAGVYHALEGVGLDSAIWTAIVTQFTHHPWNGLRAWDLVQPFFMFIVGVAMPFSFAKRWNRGDSWGKTFRHVIYRSLVLLALGLLLHCSYRNKLVWELWNVLSQLSFTYLVAFLMMRKSAKTQIGFTFVLLLLSELLYRFWGTPGFDQAFVKHHNFGSYMDTVLMGKLSAGGWVAINCLPTTAHTMWGVLAGSVLKGSRSPYEKIRVLALAGIAGLILGYAMDPMTPIIKRICTSSFVIVSGGWCLITLAFFYWLMDIRGYRRWANFAVIVGMNPIFIYMFSNTVGSSWFNGFVGIFTGGFLGWTGAGTETMAVVTAFVVLGLEWYLCYWLYRRRVFIKI